MPNSDDVLLWVLFHDFFENVSGFGFESFDWHILKAASFLGEAVSFEVESKQSSKLLNLLSKQSETQSAVSCSVDAEENDALVAGSEHWSSLI